MDRTDDELDNGRNQAVSAPPPGRHARNEAEDTRAIIGIEVDV